MAQRNTTEHLQVADLRVQVTRKSIRHLYLRLGQEAGLIKVSAPLRTSEARIRDLVLERYTWILQKQQSYHTKPCLGSERESLRLWGVEHALEWRSASPSEVRQETGVVIVSSRSVANGAGERVLQSWLKELCAEKLEQLLPVWQRKTETRIEGYRLRVMKSRWGSCHIGKRELCFNTRLVHLPEVALEYVLVHELTHLYERYHNARFYGLLDQFLPDWRERERLLKNVRLR